MTKLLILPKLNGWYYYQTHRGTKYHFHYAGIRRSICGFLDFDDRKNDKVIFTEPMLSHRVCQKCTWMLYIAKQLGKVSKSTMYPKVSRCELA